MQPPLSNCRTCLEEVDLDDATRVLAQAAEMASRVAADHAFEEEPEAVLPIRCFARSTIGTAISGSLRQRVSTG